MISCCDFPAYGNSRSSVSEDELKEKHANLNGEVLDNDHLESPSTHGTTEIVQEDCSPTRRGMVLPFLPLSLAFDSIRYSVDMPSVIDKNASVAVSSSVIVKLVTLSVKFVSGNEITRRARRPVGTPQRC